MVRASCTSPLKSTHNPVSRNHSDHTMTALEVLSPATGPIIVIEYRAKGLEGDPVVKLNCFMKETYALRVRLSFELDTSCVFVVLDICV
jgi:hypothetical protein